jgi:hypothetical protein
VLRAVAKALWRVGDCEAPSSLSGEFGVSQKRRYNGHSRNNGSSIKKRPHHSE